MPEPSPKPRVALGADHAGFPVKETIRQFLQNAGYLVVGISIAANKVYGIRAAVAHDASAARLAREHNDANVLALGGRVVSGSQAIKMVQTFLNSAFVGGRHARRVEKIAMIEQDEREKN
jgi:ribose 5-phosphate isomerase RpiB